MKRYCSIAAILLMALGATGRAQEQQKPATTPSAVAPIAVRVQVVLSRFQGDKKISSLPYTFTVNMDDRNRNAGRANLRLGTQVPITTYSRQNGDGNAPLVPTVQYRDVGTNIDCVATALDDGRFKLDLTVEDSAVEPAPGSANSPNPAFRSFRTNDSVLLRDGQTTQASTATDKVNAEVWKLDVTLNVVR